MGGGGGGGGGEGLGPCRATAPPHRVCRVTRGRRCVVLCEGDRHLCHLCNLCRPCHHDTEGGGGGGGGHRKVCRGTCRDMGKLPLYSITVKCPWVLKFLFFMLFMKKRRNGTFSLKFSFER